MKLAASLLATGTLALGGLVSVPGAATAAPYPGTVPTTCHFHANRHYLTAGQHAYALGTVSTSGNANPKGPVVAVWHGNTHGTYRAQKYKTSKNVVVGPVTPKRGTYSVTVYYIPSSSSVYQRCSTTFSQVVKKKPHHKKHHHKKHR